jgi:hypothetical protein
MNIYFLVEGRSTEKKIYPKWLSYAIPELKKVEFYDEVISNNYYLLSGGGYPSILGDALDNAIDKINKVKKYDYLVICVDADEEMISEREDFINNSIEQRKIELGETKIEIIIQNRCMETWLLGNRKIFDSRQPLETRLSEYVNYYDVSQADPELMGDYQTGNHANFHGEYLKEIFRAKGIAYSKKAPQDTQERYYFEQLQKRVEEEPTHLATFQSFLTFCDRVRSSISAKDRD